MEPVNIKNNYDLNAYNKLSEHAQNMVTNLPWLISADTIFSSEIDGYAKYSPILTVQFGIKQISMLDANNRANFSFCADNIQITMRSGKYGPELQRRMQQSKSALIKEIIIIKTNEQKKLEIIEEKKYKECVIQSFFYNNDYIEFSFKCKKYEDKYIELNKGQTSVSVDLTTMEQK